MTTTLTPGQIVTDPETDDTQFGIRIAHVGEDGNLLALDHHDKRTTLAALNRHGRIFLGWFNLAEDHTATAADWLDLITPRWAVFTTPDPLKGQDPDCTWWATFHDTPVPDTQPVMHLRVHP
jgi:hypothetical protein